MAAGCPVCGCTFSGEAYQVTGDGEQVCLDCAQECAMCRYVDFTDDGDVVIVNEDTGEQAWVCARCL